MRLPKGNSNVVRWLDRRGACAEAIEWVQAEKIATLADGWAKCQRSDWMLWLLDRVDYQNDRGMRLFACACARATWDQLTDERSRHAVEVAEKYAVGEATDEELEVAWSAAGSAAGSAAMSAESAAMSAESAAMSAARYAARYAAESAARYAAESAARYAAESAAGSAAMSAAWYAAESAARSAQSDMLRDKIGNPFQEAV